MADAEQIQREKRERLARKGPRRPPVVVVHPTGDMLDEMARGLGFGVGLGLGLLAIGLTAYAIHNAQQQE
jgi:hypothetical protein